jgi:hypothetical protein
MLFRSFEMKEAGSSFCAAARFWYAQHGHLLGGVSPLEEKVV